MCRPYGNNFFPALKSFMQQNGKAFGKPSQAVCVEGGAQ
jgi:hypothetical protein